jgi:hypothetical protein
MQSENNRKVGERSYAIALISGGVSLGVSVLVTDLIEQIIYSIVGIVFILVVLFGFHKKLSAFTFQLGGKVLVRGLSIFMPLVSVIIFSLYPIVVIFGFALGGLFSTPIIAIGIISGLLTIGNLIVLIMNIVSLLRRTEFPEV